MSYAPLSSLKDRLNVVDTASDAILQASLDWADAFINAFCNERRFAAYTATRLYGPDRIDWDDTGYTGPIPLVYGPYKRLFLDEDLLTVTAITNGDGSNVPTNGCFLEPFNAIADNSPYQSLLLKSAYAWIWTPDAQIAIAGTWGYSATPDALVINTALLLAEWHYRARGPQSLTTVFDRKTKKVTLEGFPEKALDGLEMRRRFAR